MTAGPAPFQRYAAIVLDAVAATIMFLLMLLTCVDVVGRYFFNAPIRGGLELTEVMMTLIVFAGLPLLTARRQHVTVDIVPMSRKPAVRRFHQRVVDALGVLCLAVASWQLWLRAARAMELGDVTSQLRLPLGAFIYLMSVLTAVAALALLGRLILGDARGAGEPAHG
ncbi:MAG: TRAP transporter small permease [Burkholderiaceae bacterium]